MKLVRYGKPGKEKPGLIDSDGRLRDLSAVVADIGPDQLSDPALARLRKLKTDTLPLVKGSPRMGCPVAGIGKFIAIGLNYADHAAEAGMPIPAEPIVFMKATSCIQGPDDPVMLPKGSKKSDWEVELGVVIGRQARHVSQKDALSHVAGYCVVNDVSEQEMGGALLLIVGGGEQQEAGDRVVLEQKVGVVEEAELERVLPLARRLEQLEEGGGELVAFGARIRLALLPGRVGKFREDVVVWLAGA